jgi:hypothetical protein
VSESRKVYSTRKRREWALNKLALEQYLLFKSLKLYFLRAQNCYFCNIFYKKAKGRKRE